MTANPKRISLEFFRAQPNATKQQAIEYANHKFPHAPLSIAEFMADWHSLRERYVDAKLASGELVHR
jgi:hypothetical protein